MNVIKENCCENAKNGEKIEKKALYFELYPCFYCTLEMHIQWNLKELKKKTGVQKY
jgi:deoxycytidylate deaminase